MQTTHRHLIQPGAIMGPSSAAVKALGEALLLDPVQHANNAVKLLACIDERPSEVGAPAAAASKEGHGDVSGHPHLRGLA